MGMDKDFEGSASEFEYKAILGKPKFSDGRDTESKVTLGIVRLSEGRDNPGALGLKLGTLRLRTDKETDGKAGIDSPGKPKLFVSGEEPLVLELCGVVCAKLDP